MLARSRCHCRTCPPGGAMRPCFHASCFLLAYAPSRSLAVALMPHMMQCFIPTSLAVHARSQYRYYIHLFVDPRPPFHALHPPLLSSSAQCTLPSLLFSATSSPTHTHVPRTYACTYPAHHDPATQHGSPPSPLLCSIFISLVIASLVVTRLRLRLRHPVRPPWSAPCI